MIRRSTARMLFWPTLAWNFLLGRVLGIRRWWDHIDEGLVIGALPFRRDVARLQAVGVRAVVNTCEEYCGPQLDYAASGIHQLHLPTVDFQPPTLLDIERGVAFINERIQAGDTVYVHCKAGRARSATLVLCWLMANRGLTPEEAQRYLQNKRPHVCRRLAARQVVQEFYRKYCQSANRLALTEVTYGEDGASTPRTTFLQ